MKREVTQAEWLAEAIKRFGENAADWEFECPCCGTIQTPRDFKSIGADPQSAYQGCIGRQKPRSERASDLGDTPAQNGAKRPCDYAAFGLFRALRGHVVTMDGGAVVPTLPFAGEVVEG